MDCVVVTATDSGGLGLKFLGKDADYECSRKCRQQAEPSGLETRNAFQGLWPGIPRRDSRGKKRR